MSSIFCLILWLWFMQPIHSEEILGNGTLVEHRNDENILFVDDNNKLVLLHDYGQFVLLGGRNAAYNISVIDGRVEEKYEWLTSNESRQDCEMILESDCDNFIRTFYPLQDTFVLCGTHGHHPTCASFHYHSKEALSTFSGIGLSPFEGDQRSPFHYSHGQLYSVNGPEFSASSDVILLRTNVHNGSILRTARRLFDRPAFAGILPNHKELLTFFTESPAEMDGFGLRQVTRIGRICQDDPGAERYPEEWSSFLKAGVECGIREDGLDTLHFNQLTAVSPTTDTFVGTFRSQLSGLGRSAVCILTRDQISQRFAHSLKSGKTACRRATDLDEQTNIRRNPLIRHKILASPIFVYYGEDHFTSLTVQQNATDLLKGVFDILYIATNRGRVLKVVVDKASTTSRHVATFQAVENTTEIDALWLHVESKSNQQHSTNLLILTQDKLTRVPNTACHTATSCTECLAAGDPHCAWIVNGAECVAVEQSLRRRKYMTQLLHECPRRDKISIQPEVPCQCAKSQVCEREHMSTSYLTLFSLPALFLFSSGLAVGSLINCFLPKPRAGKHATTTRIDAFAAERPTPATMSMGVQSSVQTYC